MTCPVRRSIPRKLAVWQTVGECSAIVARNLGQLVRIGWLWLLIMLPVYATLSWLEWDWRQQDEGAMLIPALLAYFIELPFLASVAVAWHRLILRQERVTAPAYLRLDSLVWLYALYSVLLTLIAAGGGVFLALVANQDGLMWTTVAVFGDLGTMLLLLGVQTLAQATALLAAVLVVLLVLPRLSLVLPALAVGERLSPAQAWRISRANTLRLALATFLCALPALVPMLAAVGWAWTGGATESQPAYVIHGAVQSLCYAVLVIFGVTLLSLAYRFFTAQHGETAVPAA